MSRVGESERNRSSRCAGMRKKNPYSHPESLYSVFPTCVWRKKQMLHLTHLTHLAHLFLLFRGGSP
jgi:hypothetical protein